MAGLPALIPFSGAISPTKVWQQMVNPILNSPPMAIWRKTTIAHSTPDGSFCLYACERTGQVMWVPSGDHFVADRPQGVQPRGTVMDYLSFQGHQIGRPSGYGLHRVSQAPSSRRYLTNIVRHRSFAATTGPRYSPMAVATPKPAGSGTHRTIARRERRQKCRERFFQPTTPPPATSINPPETPVQNSTSSEPAIPSTPPSTITTPTTPSQKTSVVFYNMQLQVTERKNYRIAQLNLSDSETDIS